MRESNRFHTRHVGKNEGKRRRIPLWLPFAVVLGIIMLAVALIWAYFSHMMNAVHDADAAEIAEEVKTAQEYQGDVVNVLICGIDYTQGRSYGETGDGMTDMILYFQFDVKNHGIHMLQIPRNTLVGTTLTCENTTGKTYQASNGQINSIVRSNPEGVAALADVIANNYQLPVDHYATINMDALTEMVDKFGGIDVYIPRDISYNGSALSAGYHRLMGADAEFLVRNRKGSGYGNSDLDRLNMQRYFYAGLFKRIRSVDVSDLINMTPVIAAYVDTDMDGSTLISLGLSFLKVDSTDIMICQTPMYPANENYEGNSVIVPDRQDIAELLNTYFRDYTGPVPAEKLYLMDDWPHSETPTSANVQYMGQLDEEANTAIRDGNTDLTDVYPTDSGSQADSAA